MRPVRLSEHFVNLEFLCKCGCGFGGMPGDVDHLLIDVLELTRMHFDTPIIITSGCRCERHNHRVGGAPRSKHLTGLAADFKVRGVSPREVADYLDATYPDRFGIGRYKTWTHLDTRNQRARWGSNG
jgi:uncharacterized protein YcbK (DUF882 family)